MACSTGLRRVHHLHTAFLLPSSERIEIRCQRTKETAKKQGKGCKNPRGVDKGAVHGRSQRRHNGCVAHVRFHPVKCTFHQLVLLTGVDRPSVPTDVIGTIGTWNTVERTKHGHFQPTMQSLRGCVSSETMGMEGLFCFFCFFLTRTPVTPVVRSLVEEADEDRRGNRRVHTYHVRRSVALADRSLGNERRNQTGGLEDGVTENTLHAAFLPFGTIRQVSLPLDVESNQHRGFAFVEFEEPGDAADAMDNMNGAELFGRVLRVNYAQPMQMRGHAAPAAVDVSRRQVQDEREPANAMAELEAATSTGATS